MKRQLATLLFALAAVLLHSASPARAAMQIDIYGPGQNIVNLAMAAPLTAPSVEAKKLGAAMNEAVKSNLSFLPFMRITQPNAVLGGLVLPAYKMPGIDLKRFQLAGADLLITAGWPKGDDEGSTVEMRLYETYSGQFVFGNAYSNAKKEDINKIADRFCADLMKALTGNGDFFLSTLAIAKNKKGSRQRDIWLVRPTGRDLRKITSIPGIAMSPSWSHDGKYVVFSHMDDRTHALGVWSQGSGRIQRIRFPGNTVIGPAFMPDNKVAVSLSTGQYPDIFLLNHSFQKERALEQSKSINVSPSFDATGQKMAFCSSRLGGPQIFLKDLKTGTITRVSRHGTYNTEPSISPDGTLVAYSRLTDQGNRIFVQDLVSGIERQVTFGPGSDEQPSFAPDSYFLAFTSNRSGMKKVYLMTRHGGDARMVPTGDGEASFARWGKLPTQ